MNPKRMLRWLIVGEVVIGLANAAVHHFSTPFLPPPLRAYLKTRGEAELNWDDWVAVGLALQMIPLLLMSYIGLWRGWRFARVLYLCTVGLVLLVMVLFGPSVMTGWAAAMEGLSWTVSGLILGLLYFSPLKDLFERPKSSE